MGPIVRSRDANRPCSCGSGKKAKKCCFAPKKTAGGEGSKKSTAAEEKDPLLEQWRSQFEVVQTGVGKKRIVRMRRHTSDDVSSRYPSLYSVVCLGIVPPCTVQCYGLCSARKKKKKS